MIKKPYNWEILSLTRFLLAFIVLVEHLKGAVNVGFWEWYAKLGSFEAILGFLLISGLSIGKSIAKNKESYFKRRIQRIYPVYLASIILQLFVFQAHFTFGLILTLVINLLFLNQIVTGVSFVGPAWTLAAEVWLYALAPVFLKLSRKTLIILVYVSFICYCVYTCGRTLYHWEYFAGTKYGINLVLLAFIWIAGFVLAVFPDDKKAMAMHVAIIFLTYLGLNFLIQGAFMYKHHQLTQLLTSVVPEFLCKTLCLAWVYYVVIYNHKVPFLSTTTHKVFNFLGNISYPLYLTHSSVFYYFEKKHWNNMYLMMGAAVLTSCIIYWAFDFYSKKRVAKY